MRQLDDRIANAADLRELVLLTEVRGEILRQDRNEDEARNRRRIEMWQVIGGYIFSGLALLSVMPLLLLGYVFPALFLLGGAAFMFVPRYVLAVLRQRREPDDS